MKMKLLPMAITPQPQYFFIVLISCRILLLLLHVAFAKGVVGVGAISAVGDPGMSRDGLRVAFEAWNFCNEVGKEAPAVGSPRAADCFDLSSKTESGWNGSLSNK